MFAPFDGVPEDPATGSANCALGGLLTYYNNASSGNFEWKIAQGFEMGRPSSLNARTQKKDGEIISTYIGGGSVMVSEGVIFVDWMANYPCLLNYRGQFFKWRRLRKISVTVLKYIIESCDWWSLFKYN